MEYNKELKSVQSNIKNYTIAEKRYISGAEILKSYLSNIKEPYSKSKLDSLKQTLKDKEEIKDLQYLINYVKYNNTLSSIRNQKRLFLEIIEYKLNFDFNERYLTNDNTDDLHDFPYGNNDVQGVRKISHSTKVSSVIAATRNDTLVEGISHKLKIMPLSISVAGNEHDKDIALAIKYAVDNGAKVINMTIGKDFSWADESIHDVARRVELIITKK